MAKDKDNLIEKLTTLANEWEARAREQVPDNYSKRGLDGKYLRLDNEAAGLSICAEELQEILEEASRPTMNSTVCCADCSRVVKHTRPSQKIICIVPGVAASTGPSRHKEN